MLDTGHTTLFQLTHLMKILVFPTSYFDFESGSWRFRISSESAKLEHAMASISGSPRPRAVSSRGPSLPYLLMNSEWATLTPTNLYTCYQFVVQAQ